MELFQPINEKFKDIIHSISKDLHVLRFAQVDKTKDLLQTLIDGLSTMEVISNQMADLLNTLREQFSRLWFLSDREVMQLLSFHPTPFMLQPFVQKCFKGVERLHVDCEASSDTEHVKDCRTTSENQRQSKVLGVFGSLQERVPFLCPLEPNPSAVSWFSIFEKQLKSAMARLMVQSSAARNQIRPSQQDLANHNGKVVDTLCLITERRKTALHVMDLLSQFPLQCLLVAEEAAWCRDVLETFQKSSPVTLRGLKAYNTAKLRDLSHSIRDSSKGEAPLSQYAIMCLHALVLLTMNHLRQLSQLIEVQDVSLEASFEWLSFMKYHVEDGPTCYIDVLGHRLQYDYEYFGPEGWEMVHTPSTDRGMLGILHALLNYRGGFVSGPHMSGKKATVAQLGKALGRQVVIVQCSPDTRPGFVQQMLLGALQCGAWLLFDSVDSLPQGLLTLLGQHLEDIHQSFFDFTRNRNQGVREDVPEHHVVLSGNSVSARLSFGCVLISMKRFTRELPESLRCATRPVVLTQPNYRIIAEVMLTSIGFSEAVPLSRQLVCLISLAKDSLSLPKFISDDQSYMVLLQQIISASEIHLRQLVKEREVKNKEQTGHVSSPNMTVDRDRKVSSNPSKLCSMSIIQGIMEEAAIVKAILTVLLPVIYEQDKALCFYSIFKDTFPIVCQFPQFQHHVEEEEMVQIKDAITKELQSKWSHPDPGIISSALTLYQTMKVSQAVLLIGPSGSGKTTCYRALAGAINRLGENDSTAEGASSKTSVDTVVLFPNAMSHKELFGYVCEKRGWQDGAVAKVLRDSGWHKPTVFTNGSEKSCRTQIVKWLIMDGKPGGQPGWLDHITTLCRAERPFLWLSSGETLPAHSNLKLLVETTDLRDASPAAVTRCSLVSLTGTNLWQVVWKSEVDALSHEHKLGQGTLKMWNCLAGDLFSSTLSLLHQNASSSAIRDEDELSHTYGLQEIMSFVRILRALLQHFREEVEIHETEDEGETIVNEHRFL